MGMVHTLVVKDWVELFRFKKALVLKEADLEGLLDEVSLVLAWDYNDAKDKFSVFDVKDYLVDVFEKLRDVNGMREVVVITGRFAEEISDPLLFPGVLHRYFGLDYVVRRVKEKWEDGLIVPWWYTEKLIVFDNWLSSIVNRLADVYLGLNEVKELYVRKCRGRLRLFLWVVVSEEFVEWHGNDLKWEESSNGVKVLGKLRRVEEEVRDLFPLVKFEWNYLHERDFDDFNLNWLPGVEFVFGKGKDCVNNKESISREEETVEGCNGRIKG
jgi:hypothetical protein